MNRARILYLAITVILVALIFPSGSSADGLPLPVEDVGPSGIANADSRYRFVTLDDGQGTLVESIEQDGGEVSKSIDLNGDYTIPAVGLDGSPGGLSADGRTLVLIRPRSAFPRATTEFVRFDTRDLRHPHPFRLDGDFSFDAISPDGRTMYLINYLSPRDPAKYHVRAYDLARNRLEPGAIVDPNEDGDEMYGYALSREASPDGRWAYTLYWGTERPFVHALDTVRGEAVCIDLDSLERVRNMYSLGFEIDDAGSQLLVTQRGDPSAAVDTQTFAVGPPSSPGADGSATSGGADWVAPLAIGGGVALLAVTALMTVRRRGRAAA